MAGKETHEERFCAEIEGPVMPALDPLIKQYFAVLITLLVGVQLHIGTFGSAR